MKQSKREEKYDITFKFFEALQKSAETWFETVMAQKNQAINALNKSIELHNDFTKRKMKLIAEASIAIDKDNARIMELYAECNKTLKALEKKLDEYDEVEHEDTTTA